MSLVKPAKSKPRQCVNTDGAFHHSHPKNDFEMITRKKRDQVHTRSARSRIHWEDFRLSEDVRRLEEQEDALLCMPDLPGRDDRLKEVQEELRGLEARREALREDGCLLSRFPADYKPKYQPRHRRQAYELHKEMGRRGIRDHAGYASAVIGRRTEHLSNLTRSERNEVRAAMAAGRIAA